MSAQVTPTEQSDHGAALGFIAGFAPWIVYWILSGTTSFTVAVAVPFAIAVLSNLLNLWRHRPIMVLEVGNAVVFALLAIIGWVAGDAWVSRWIQPLGNAGLLAIMVVSVLIGRPFTLQYARAATPPELWESPGFLAVNRLLTWMWIAAMAIMTALALVPPIVQGEATRDDGGSALSIIFYWVLPYIVLGLAILFTAKYPDWFGAEFDDQPATEGSRQPPIPATLDGDNSRAGSLVLEAGPQQALIDEPITLTMRGAHPDSQVVLTATNVDLVGNVWRSTASYTADNSGAVDTSTMPAVAGDYRGVDPRGLIWAMRFTTEGATPEIYLPPPGPTAVAIEAKLGGTVLTKTLVRRSMWTGVSTTDVRDDGVVGRLLLPVGDGPFPGVALFGGSEGGLDSQHSNAALLASHGFAALIVGYFGLDGLDAELVSIPLERLASGVQALAANERVDRRRVGALCISRGAEGVLNMAARVDDVPLTAIVAISPSQVSWTAIGQSGTLPGTPSWTLAGRPVPHLDMADHVLMSQAMRDAVRHRGHHDPHHPHLLHLADAYAAALDGSQAAEQAAIPVERINGPLLLLSGSDDQVWPSGPMADAIARRRQQAGLTAADHHQHYQGGGHLIRLGCLPTDVTSTDGIALGGTREGIAAAQADATSRVLQFFGENLS